MSGEKGQIVGWIFWSVLTAGAGCSCVGLTRSVLRFRQWKQATAELEGEIVLGDRALQAGQTITVSIYDPQANDGEAIRGQICAIQKKTLTLTLEAAFSEGHFQDEGVSRRFAVGATVVVTVTGERALYRFTARVGDMRADAVNARQSLLTVVRPLWLGRIQRRQHVRVAMPIPATFERATHYTSEGGSIQRAKPGPAEGYMPLHGSVIDLSAGGLMAEVGSALGAKEAAKLVEAFVPGTILRVRLPLPALSDSLLARVRSCERAVSRGGLGVRLACQFLPMSHCDQEMLVHHIFRAQKDLLRTRFEPPIHAEPSDATRS